MMQGVKRKTSHRNRTDSLDALTFRRSVFGLPPQIWPTHGQGAGGRIIQIGLQPVHVCVPDHEVLIYVRTNLDAESVSRTLSRIWWGGTRRSRGLATALSQAEANHPDCNDPLFLPLISFFLRQRATTLLGLVVRMHITDAHSASGLISTSNSDHPASSIYFQRHGFILYFLWGSIMVLLYCKKASWIHGFVF